MIFYTYVPKKNFKKCFHFGKQEITFNSYFPICETLGRSINDAQLSIVEQMVDAKDISELLFLEVEHRNSPLLLMESLIHSMQRKTPYIKLTVKRQWSFQSLTETYQ